MRIHLSSRPKWGVSLFFTESSTTHVFNFYDYSILIEFENYWKMHTANPVGIALLSKLKLKAFAVRCLRKTVAKRSPNLTTACKPQCRTLWIALFDWSKGLVAALESARPTSKAFSSTRTRAASSLISPLSSAATDSAQSSKLCSLKKLLRFNRKFRSTFSRAVPCFRICFSSGHVASHERQNFL